MTVGIAVATAVVAVAVAYDVAFYGGSGGTARADAAVLGHAGPGADAGR